MSFKMFKLIWKDFLIKLHEQYQNWLNSKAGLTKVSETFKLCKNKVKTPNEETRQGFLMYRRRHMFPGGRPPSIFSAKKLNYCVRNGNRCDLLAITTDFVF